MRGVLKQKRKAPTWLDVPQMMRLTITTCNVLERLGDWEVARPYNFLLMPMVDPLFGYAFDRPKKKVLLVTTFSSKQERWFDLKCINIYSGKKYKMVDANKERTLHTMWFFPLNPDAFWSNTRNILRPRVSRPIERHAKVTRKDAQACYRCGRASLHWKGDGSQMGRRRRYQRLRIQDNLIWKIEDGIRD